jgi:hypothetical protein
MKNLLEKKAFLTIVIAAFVSAAAYAQDGNISISQDPKFEQMLAEKRKINGNITVNDRYKIQIFNGDSEASKKSLVEFKKSFPNHDATIVFSTPSYKVWAGSFKSRIEAERNLAEVKKKFPNAFVIRPNR